MAPRRRAISEALPRAEVSSTVPAGERRIAALPASGPPHVADPAGDGGRGIDIVDRPRRDYFISTMSKG